MLRTHPSDTIKTRQLLRDYVWESDGYCPCSEHCVNRRYLNKEIEAAHFAQASAHEDWNATWKLRMQHRVIEDYMDEMEVFEEDSGSSASGHEDKLI